MKKIKLSFALSIMLLNSCTTRVVSSSKPYSDDKIAVGKSYTIFTQNGKKESLKITKIDSQNIYGEDFESNKIVVEKSKILEIKRFKTLATVGLIVGVIGLALVGDAYYHQKPIGQ